MESGHCQCAHFEKEAAGFFASGRRLEFEECIANLNVDFVGIQEGRQRSSVTRQVGRYFVVSAAADLGSRWPGSVGTSQARLQPRTHYHSLV